MPILHTAQAVFMEGPDAIAFAHSQFASQVTALADRRWQFSSWLDAQGRVRNLFHLVRLGDERLLVILRGGDATSFMENLRRFVFRSRIKLSVTKGSLAGAAATPLHEVDMQDDVIRLGCGTHAMLFGDNVSSDDAWRLQQLREGWAWLPDNALNELVPPALSLHRLGAVAIDKGCYPGQEIVARLHYRGGNKRHLHHVALSRHVAEGSLLQRENREFVRMLDVITHAEQIEALAVITDEASSQFGQHDEKITSAEGVDVQLLNTWPA
ncbi:YgfZ/GcvT domain-containing protein [Dyella choica]|uniref:Folate-binding protein n=1 Tax=Dyella choica TaxID=1927959 RepID=A0A432MC59_9GAMM|nr:folate-binding protein [Dyella choica]RUL79806.1 folate-binding protein [Dyella choica]